jgi:hypothetical protein
MNLSYFILHQTHQNYLFQLERKIVLKYSTVFQLVFDHCERAFQIFHPI